MINGTAQLMYLFSYADGNSRNWNCAFSAYLHRFSFHKRVINGIAQLVYLFSSADGNSRNWNCAFSLVNLSSKTRGHRHTLDRL